MAFPTYGKHLLKSFGEKPAPLVDRTQMEKGPAKQRRRVKRRPVARPCAYLYTLAEYAQFKTWVDTEGANSTFDWTDPLTGTTKLAQLVGGLYEAKARKGQNGGELEMVVTFELEVYE